MLKKRTYIIIGIVFLVAMILNVINVVYYKSGSMEVFWKGTMQAIFAALFYLGIAFMYSKRKVSKENSPSI